MNNDANRKEMAYVKKILCSNCFPFHLINNFLTNKRIGITEDNKYLKKWFTVPSLENKLLLAIQFKNLNGFLRAANEIWFSKELNSAYEVSPNLNCCQ